MSSKRSSSILAAGAGVAVATCLALGASAGAAYASGPSASVSLSASNVTAGTDPALSYNVSGAPSGASIYLVQSTDGGQSWQPVGQLSTSRGSVNIQPSAAGTFNYEVVVEQGGTVVVSSAPTTLTVNNNSQSGNSWVGDVVSFLGQFLAGAATTIGGLLGL
jgi:hypothetical protein